VLHPLDDTLARLGGRVHAARLDAPDGWLTMDDVRGDAYDDVVDIAAAGYDTNRGDIRGNRMVEIWTWLVATPAVAALLVDRRLPDVGADNLSVAPGLWSDPAPVALRRGRFWCLPGDPAADHPDATVLPDVRALVLELNAMLRERHLPALIETVAVRSRRPRRALWRGATDQLVGSFTRAGAALGCEDDALALARIAGDGEPPMRTRVRIERFELADRPPQTLHLREGCCLYYRVDSRPPNCSNCPLVDDAERVALLAAELRAMEDAA
jgi:hypothetical protein